MVLMENASKHMEDGINCIQSLPGKHKRGEKDRKVDRDTHTDTQRQTQRENFSIYLVKIAVPLYKNQMKTM